MNIKTRTVIAGLVASLTTGVSAQAPTLNIGDPAPPIVVSQWLKQQPDLKYKTIVVEFWATWCGPCLKTIPHLTELKRKFTPGVVFVGVASSEQDWAAPGKFVAEMGDRMDYSVGLDKDGTMANTWLHAAGETQIPTAFIVDYSGQIAWIGDPMQLEQPLEVIVSSVGGIEKFRQERETKRAKVAETARLMDEYRKWSAAKDWDRAIESLNELERGAMDVGGMREATFRQANDVQWLGRYVSSLTQKANAALETYTDASSSENAVAAVASLDQIETSLREVLVNAKLERLKVYFKTGDGRFAAYAKALVTGPERDDPKVLNRVAWLIAGPDSALNKKLEKITIAKYGGADVPAGYTNPPVWPAGTIDRAKLLPLANAAATRAVALTGRKNPGYLDTLAWVKFQMGNVTEASKLQKESASKAPENSFARLSSDAIAKWMVGE